MALARAGALTLALPLLQSCTAGLLAAGAVPAVIDLVAIGGAEEQSPWQGHNPSFRPMVDENLAALDARILQAECGDAESQFWLASALKNNLDTTPNYVETYKWFRLAQIGEFEPATEQLTTLDVTMSKSDITKARALSREWHPKTEGCPDTG